MSMDVVVFARFLLTGVAMLMAFLAVAAWNRRKDAPEASVFALLAATMSIYAFGYAGEVAQTTVVAPRRWLDLEYVALPWAPALLLMVATRHNRLRVRTPILFIIPVIVLLDHYANFRNSFYSGPITMARHGPFWTLVMPRGPISTLDNAYLLVAFLAAAWVYLSRARYLSPVFRKQAWILLVSSLVPLAGYFFYLIDLSPWGLDITPVALAFTGVLMYYGIFFCGIFVLAPIARELIFNSMRDAVLVLDPLDRLLDFNPAAEALLPMIRKEGLGRSACDLLAELPGFVDALVPSQAAAEVSLVRGQTTRFYEIRTWPLSAGSGSAFSTKTRGHDSKTELDPSPAIGRAVILADVTDQVQLREELRQRAETDPLTGIANRRRFHQALEIECLRYKRGRAPFSVLMIDLDFFKEVNDNYGHPVGDLVLRRVSQHFLGSLRKTDLLARYGGEEFAVLLPETRIEGAGVIAERIRAATCQTPLQIEGLTIPVTVSVGVASHGTDLEVDPLILLKKADLALYRAKALGRNRIEVA